MNLELREIKSVKARERQTGKREKGEKKFQSFVVF